VVASEAMPDGPAPADVRGVSVTRELSHTAYK